MSNFRNIFNLFPLSFPNAFVGNPDTNVGLTPIYFSAKTFVHAGTVETNTLVTRKDESKQNGQVFIRRKTYRYQPPNGLRKAVRNKSNYFSQKDLPTTQNMTNKFKIDFLEDYSQSSLLEELQRLQKIVGDRPITKADIDKYSKAGWTTYFRKFGSFSKALLAAGLDTSRRVNVINEELINAVVELWTLTLQKDGRRPFCSDLKKYKIPYSQDTYRRRFGNWKKALILAYNSVDKKENIEQEIIDDKVIQRTLKNIREEISIRRRFLVFKRDQFTCVRCGRSGIGIKLEVDHKNPVSKGGSNSIDNLQTLCFECNRGKRNDEE